MVLSINTYVDPGVFFGEVVVPGAINITATPFTLAIIANGNRDKRITDEAVQRGSIENEPLTVAGTSPHTATLIERSDRRVANTTILADGVPLGINDISYVAPQILGTAAGPFDISNAAGVAFGIEMDGNLPLTLILIHNAVPVAPVIVGSQITIEETFSGAGGNAATLAEVATAINSCLAAATDAGLGVSAGDGYGTSYAAVASDGTTGILIVSPENLPTSDVRVFPAIAPFAADSAVLFGAASVDAPSVIQVIDAVFDAGAAYTTDYISIVSDEDFLENTNVQNLIRVGSFTGTSDFTKNIDYQDGAGIGDDGNAQDTVDWSIDAAATFTGSAAETYDVSANTTIILAFDGGPQVSVVLDGLGTPFAGYADAAVPAAATAAEMAANINAVLANNVNYGARFNGVATTVTVGPDTFLVLTSPTDGVRSQIDIIAPLALSAVTEIFGLQAAQLPFEIMGTGRRPSASSIYFVTYDFTRPSSEYDVPIRHFTIDQAFAQVGGVTPSNPLAIASEIAFLNDAPSIFTIQVNDVSTPGSPTRNEILDSLTGAGNTDSITEVVVLDTRLSVQTDLLNHIEVQNAPAEKHFRRGYFGMARDTDVGDPDTPDTHVYRATRTLQVLATSPARGRLILSAPPNVSRTIRDENSVETKVNLDGTYPAVAVAARLTSFTSPAEALARKRVTGFDIDDFEVYLKQERALLASQGTTVVTLDAGRLILLDPITTERGGGGVIQFEQIQSSTQKDNLIRKLDRAIDANLVGVVPADLTDFIVDVKGLIGSVISGEVGNGSLGPFRDENGFTRPINLLTDVQVFQDQNDPTKFNFAFFFNLRFPALRFFGEFSVDNPFFSVAGTTQTA